MPKENLTFSIRLAFISRSRCPHLTLGYNSDSLLNNMDSGNKSGVIYPNLKKAFGTVKSRHIIEKIVCVGTDSNCLLWLNRTFVSELSVMSYLIQFLTALYYNWRRWRSGMEDDGR